MADIVTVAHHVQVKDAKAKDFRSLMHTSSPKEAKKVAEEMAKRGFNTRVAAVTTTVSEPKVTSTHPVVAPAAPAKPAKKQDVRGPKPSADAQIKAALGQKSTWKAPDAKPAAKPAAKAAAKPAAKPAAKKSGTNFEAAAAAVKAAKGKR